MSGIKSVYRTEFPRVGRVLVVIVESDKAAIVRVTDGSTGQIISSKRFEDYNETMDYYSEQFVTLKTVEEFEVMRCMIEKFVRKMEVE